MEGAGEQRQAQHRGVEERQGLRKPKAASHTKVGRAEHREHREHQGHQVQRSRLQQQLTSEQPVAMEEVQQRRGVRLGYRPYQPHHQHPFAKVQVHQ